MLNKPFLGLCGQYEEAIAAQLLSLGLGSVEQVGANGHSRAATTIQVTDRYAGQLSVLIMGVDGATADHNPIDFGNHKVVDFLLEPITGTPD